LARRALGVSDSDPYASHLSMLRAEIAQARAELAAAVDAAPDLTSRGCLAKSRHVDSLVVRYMRLDLWNAPGRPWREPSR
jgi:hypothetical protein